MRQNRAAELPRYDSLKQCAAATGIPFEIVKRAKDEGCTAFKNGRVDLGPLLKFLFTHESSALDLPALQAEQVKLQNEKLTAQNAILRREWVSSDDVRKWGAELGHAAKLIVESIHLCAPNLEGLSSVEIASKLRDKETEVLTLFSTIGETLQQHEQEVRRDLFQE